MNRWNKLLENSYNKQETIQRILNKIYLNYKYI